MLYSKDNAMWRFTQTVPFQGYVAFHKDCAIPMTPFVELTNGNASTGLTVGISYVQFSSTMMSS